MLLILQDNQAVAMLCTKWAVFYIEMNLEATEVKKKIIFIGSPTQSPKMLNKIDAKCIDWSLALSSQHKINHNDITPANDQQCPSNCKVC